MTRPRFLRALLMLMMMLVSVVIHAQEKYVSEIRVIVQTVDWPKNTTVDNGKTYTLVCGYDGKPFNLNAGTGSNKRIYLGMLYTTDYREAISDIRVYDLGDSKEAPPQTYEKEEYYPISRILTYQLATHTDTYSGSTNEGNAGRHLYFYTCKYDDPTKKGYDKLCIDDITEWGLKRGIGTNYNLVNKIELGGGYVNFNEGVDCPGLYIKYHYVRWRCPSNGWKSYRYTFDMSQTSATLDAIMGTLPDKATITSSDPSVVSIKNINRASEGSVDIAWTHPGEATLTLKTQQDNENRLTTGTWTTKITVNLITTTLNGVPYNLKIDPGQERQMNITSTNEAPLTYKVTSGEEYISVDQTGKITALASGYGEITVSQPAHGNYSAISNVVPVTVALNNNLAFDQPTYTVTGHNQLQLSATSISNAAMNYEIIASDDDQVKATIDKNGVFQAKGIEGTVQVKVYQKANSTYAYAADIATVNVVTEPYAVYDGDSTLTFKYDMLRDKEPTSSTTYAMNTGSNSPEWKEVANKIQTVAVEENFKNYLPESGYEWFYQMSALKNFTGIENINTSEMKNMEYMFSDCDVLEWLNLSGFSTAAKPAVDAMFEGCTNLKVIIVDPNKWKVTNLLATTMMFDDCTSLVGGNGTPYSVNTGGYANRAHVDSSSNPGYFTSNTAKVPYAVLDDEGALTVYMKISTEMPHSDFFMFTPSVSKPTWAAYATRVKKMTFDSSASYCYFNTTQEWCKGMSNLTEFDGRHLYFDRIKNVQSMFEGCKSLTMVELSNGKTGLTKVTNMQNLFKDCIQLRMINIANMDVSHVTNMERAFYNCASLRELNVSKWNTENVTNMAEMFTNCYMLEVLDVSHFNTAKVENMSGMFMNCQRLKELDVSNFNTEKVTDMSNMFYGCSVLQSLDVSGFNTAKVGDMTNMFRQTTYLTSLDISNFNYQSCLSIDYMLYSCVQLTKLYAGDFALGESTSCKDVFNEVGSASAPFTMYVGPNFSMANVTDMGGYYTMADAGGSFVFANKNNLTDSNPTLAAGNYSEGYVGYTRNATVGRYGSFCLPFDIKADNDMFDKIYTSMDIALYHPSNRELTIMLKKGEGIIPAGTPFIARIKTAPVVLANATPCIWNNDMEKSEKHLKVYEYEGGGGALRESEAINAYFGGTYRLFKSSEIQNWYSFNAADGSYSPHMSNLNPFRAYISSNFGEVAKAKSIQLMFADEETTDIRAMIENLESEQVRVYSLDGRLIRTGVSKDKALDGLTSGVYIVNGKKVIK